MKNSHPSLGLLWKNCAIIVALVAVMLSTLVVQAQQAAFPDAMQRSELDPLIETSSEPPSEWQNPAPSVTAGGLFAYQVYVNRNWEIEVSDISMSNDRIIASSTATDLYPDVRRGDNAIVFASNRSNGQYEIFRMSASGQGITRLTTVPRRDSRPVWSFDGKLIAYESERTRQADVYVMDENGGNDRRLTNSAEFDGMPTWSPDGTQLAFSSRRTGGYRIYTMNADGSNVQQISAAPYSLRPQWSPDGKQIAFDADPDRDGWQELMLVNSDGSDERMIWDIESQSDVWVSDWSATGSAVLFTEVDFIKYQGEFYIDSLRLDSYFVGSNSGFREVTFDLEAEASFATNDVTAPNTRIRRLPRYSQPTDFLLFEESDGVPHAFQIEAYSYQTNAWQRLPTGEYEFPYRYDGAYGDTVAFRTRARDDVFNIEPWPTTPDTQTTFVNQFVRGTVSDNRGNPLPNLPVVQLPNTLDPAITDHNGQFASFTIQEDAYQFAPQATGFSAFPAQQFSADAPLSVAGYLPPADNQISNGSFETAGAWQLSNGTALFSAESSHSGQQGLRLGLACGQNCLETTLLPDDIGEVIGSVIDSQGGVHLLAHRSYDLYLYSWAIGTKQWEIEPVGYATFSYADMAISTDDTIHLAINDPESAQQPIYLRRPVGEGWEAFPAPVQNVTVVHEYAVSAQGSAAAIYSLELSVSRAEWLAVFQDGQWKTLAIDTGTNGGDYYSGRIVWDDQDRLHLFWSMYTQTEGGTERMIWHSVYSAASGWQDSRPIVRSQAVGWVDVDSDGALHLTFWREGQQVYQRFDGNLAAPPATAPNDSWAILLDAGKNGKANLFLANQNGAALYNYSPNSGSIEVAHQLPMKLSSGSNSIWFADNGAPVITFRDDAIRYNVARLPQLEQAVAASARQTVTILADSEAATLSWMQRGLGDLATDGTAQFSVMVNGVGVYDGVVSAEWQQKWVDISAWAGQTVEIAFVLQQERDAQLAQIDIDDVALGSAYPNSWISLASLANSVLLGDLFSADIHYGNYSTLAAVDGRVTLVLPDGISLEAADPAVSAEMTTPTWDIAALAATSNGTIRLKLRVDQPRPFNSTIELRADLTHSGSDAATWDNVATLKLPYAAKIALPVIVK